MHDRRTKLLVAISATTNLGEELGSCATVLTIIQKTSSPAYKGNQHLQRGVTQI